VVNIKTRFSTVPSELTTNRPAINDNYQISQSNLKMENRTKSFGSSAQLSNNDNPEISDKINIQTCQIYNTGIVENSYKSKNYFKSDLVLL
jgi:hypothetical protein